MKSRPTTIDHRPCTISPSSDERGVALILTLAILALVTLLLIAFVTSMRVENAASKNFNELVKARELARGGVDEAVGTIRTFTPLVTPNGPGFNGTNYVTAPGMIYAYSQNIPTATHWTNVMLYTPDPANPNGIVPTVANMLITNEVDLNANLVITGSGTVYNASSLVNTQLWVGWSSVLVTNSAAPKGVLVGRYAYWVDDESAKVDVNVATSRGNDLEGYTPAALDLWTLFQADPQATLAEVRNLTNYVQNTRPLDTIESMTMLSPPLPTMPSGYNAPGVSTNTFANTQFYVTTHATSPDLTPWGDQRTNLSTLVTNTTSPQNAVTAVYNSLTKEDNALGLWTGSANRFATKYNNNLLQIAANIVDYIGYPGTGLTPTDGGGTPPIYLGLKQTPYLNELVISNTFQASVTTPGVLNLTVNSYPYVELWYMYNNTNGWASSGSSQVALQYALSMTLGGGFSPPRRTISSQTLIAAPTKMGPNSYSKPTGAIAPIWSFTATLPYGGLQPPPVTITLSPSTATATFSQSGGRTDYAVIGLTNNAVISVPVGGAGTFSFWAAQCNDPRVKPVSTDWHADSSPSIGSPNANPYNLGTSGGSGGLLPDGDTSCHTYAANLTANGVNLTGVGRQRGAMTPGELAFIHTGVPWRTLHLQPPASGSEPGPPDWAMLDWFSAANTLSADVVGRVNINQNIHAVTPLSRLNPISPYGCPLTALLTNNWQLPGYNQQHAASNITNYPYGSQYYVQNPTSLGPNFCPYAYTMVGEIANTQSLSNWGSPPGTSKLALETPVRDIANIITTRSDTFTVWCLAQSVKKVDKTSPAAFVPGTDVVTGEAKVQAIVERYEDASTSPPTIKFRTLSYRYYYQ